MRFRSFNDADVLDKRGLLRVDLNVPGARWALVGHNAHRAHGGGDDPGDRRPWRQGHPAPFGRPKLMILGLRSGVVRRCGPSHAFSVAHRGTFRPTGLRHELPAYTGCSVPVELDVLEKALQRRSGRLRR